MLLMQRDKAINMYSLTCSICILIVIFINIIPDALLCFIRILVSYIAHGRIRGAMKETKYLLLQLRVSRTAKDPKQRRYHLEILLQTKLEHTILFSFISRNFIFIPKVYCAFFIFEMPSVTNKGSFRFARACEGNFSTVWWTQRAT
jgi:hypothetical protein